MTMTEWLIGKSCLLCFYWKDQTEYDRLDPDDDNDGILDDEDPDDNGDGKKDEL